EKLKSLHLIVPIWTMGQITAEQRKPVIEAVASGVGLCGCHGGMCDAFRNDVDWQFMTGGQWVSHPGGGVEYTVNICNSSSPIVDGMLDFKVVSEQYYVHVDPCVEVLATTRFPVAPGYHASNKQVDVPVTWTKRWGYGRVFYTSLGHVASVFGIPEVPEMMRRGFLWAAQGKDIAVEKKLDPADFKDPSKIF
ncbi:MAG TPA: hypothetical protein DD727_02985, partial [Clostridiales bacterium]|nr:hypothetical protein [Clostridiales bacterium]